jgi:hypothetical protein
VYGARDVEQEVATRASATAAEIRQAVMSAATTAQRVTWSLDPRPLAR